MSNYPGLETNEIFNDGSTANTIVNISLAGYLDSYRYSNEEQPSEFTSPECVYFPKNASMKDVDYCNMLLALSNRDVEQIIYSFAEDTPKIFEYIRENADRLCKGIEDGTISVDVKWSAAEMKVLRGYLVPDSEHAQEIRKILADEIDDGIAGRLWKKLKYVTCSLSKSESKNLIRKYYGDISHNNGVVATHAGVFGEAVDGADYYELSNGVNFYEFLEKGSDENVKPVFCSDQVYTGLIRELISGLKNLIRKKYSFQLLNRVQKG